MEDSNAEAAEETPLPDRNSKSPGSIQEHVYEAEPVPTNNLNLSSNARRRSTTSSSSSPHAMGRGEVSAAEMSEQLSSLIGLSPAASKAPEKSSRTKSPSPSPRPVLPFVVERESRTNGNANKTSASSSPSREVEEILSPKTTQQNCEFPLIACVKVCKQSTFIIVLK